MLTATFNMPQVKFPLVTDFFILLWSEKILSVISIFSKNRINSHILQNNFNYLFNFWLWWIFVAARAFSVVAVSEGSCLVAVCRLLIVVAYHVVKHKL